MAKKSKKKVDDRELAFEQTAPVIEQPIVETIEKNYMPYAMSVIIARAIPEIDGFKPSHRKVLYDVQNGTLNRRKNQECQRSRCYDATKSSR